jgi:uncharacterized damage-inducible protein DinB
MDAVTDSVLQYARQKLPEYLGQIERCLRLLSDEQVWWRPNESTNAVANLVMHLRGNVGQWLVAGVGGQAFQRDRPSEFAARGGPGREALMSQLAATVHEALQVLQRLPPSALAQQCDIQGYRVTVATAIVHVVEHFAFHTGQIIHAAKWLTGADLSLYDAQGHRRDGRRSGAP